MKNIPDFVVINSKERGRELDEVIKKINEVFLEHKIASHEAIWLLEHLKFQILTDDLNETG